MAPGRAAPVPEAVLAAHQDNVYCVRVDGEGKRFLSASADNSVKIWDLASRRALITLEHRSPVYEAAFSPGGPLIATCSGDGQVALWQGGDGVRVRVLEGHQAPVYCLSFSADGSLLATGSGEPENACLVWEVASGRLLARAEGHERPIYGVAFSASWLATSSSDKTIRLWPRPAFDKPRLLTGHTSDVYRCAFSPDEALLATVSQDKTVRVWDVASGAEKLVLRGHADPVYGLAFSPDGKVLATCGDDRVIHFWDTRSGAPSLAWKEAHPQAIYTLAFLPGRDGILVSAGAEGAVHLWKGLLQSGE